jgi:hypothetical protein
VVVVGWVTALLFCWVVDEVVLDLLADLLSSDSPSPFLCELVVCVVDWPVVA